MNNTSNPVLALYDFRAKQKFIYRTNKIKEIVGGSSIIENGFFTDAKKPEGPLVEEAKKIGIAIVASDNVVFSPQLFNDEQPKGVIVYEGGGNLNILFDSEDTCVRLNKAFSKYIMEKYYGLNMICSYVDANLEEDDFRKTRAELYRKHSQVENTDISIDRCNVLPFVQVDRKTSFPLSRINKDTNDKDPKVSIETDEKLKAYKEKIEKKDNGSENTNYLLDDYVTEKGEESLLAVVYIDGNNMGEKIRKKLDASTSSGKVSWNEGTKALKDFSEEIQNVFVEDGFNALDSFLTEKAGIEIKNGNPTNKVNGDMWKYCYRTIVGAGDEITFICNARLAFELAKKYLESVNKKGYSSCAGICVFHSHTPFSDAYRIAEECCESAKDKCREYDGETSWIDFQYCQSGINSSLETIRKHEGIDKISRPWVITGLEEIDDKGVVGLSEIELMKNKLNNPKIGRNNVKSLLEHAFDSEASFENEKGKIIAHHSLAQNYFDIDGLNPETSKKLVYDMVLMFDVWFDKTKRL